ncbi:MAG: hypothetical protein QGH33_17015 [Pirellulaceae bacterium]|nr:hypothetical protein [Pirellulaceae bacterium]
MAKSSNKRRRKQFVDRAVQGTLLLHLVAHWVFFLLAAVAFLYFVEMLAGDPRNLGRSLFHRHGPTVLAVLVLAPIFLLDLCKLSNWFAGPVIRLRRGMRELAEGRDVSQIKFRENDFWQDLATDFNQVVERVQEAESRSANAMPLQSDCHEAEPEAEPELVAVE